MIYDGENNFFLEKALSNATLTSDVIFVGAGEAGCPATLSVTVANGSSSGTLSTVLKTSASSDMSNAVTLATYSTVPVAAKIPRGNLGYLQLVCTSTYAAGSLTAGLVLDDDVEW